MCRPYWFSKKITDQFVHCGMKLRALAGNHTHPFDLIMLHIHAQDVLPVYALSAGYYGPPVALFDHSDHTFWIGSSIVDVRLTLVSLRRCLCALCDSLPSLPSLPLLTFIAYHAFFLSLAYLPSFQTFLSFPSCFLYLPYLLPSCHLDC